MSAYLAEKLRDLADHMERDSSPPVIETGLTMQEAYTKLCDVLPRTASFSICVELTRFGHGKESVQFKIWDGKEFHNASTLSGAVAAAIAASVETSTTPVVAATNALAVSEPAPF